MLRTLVFTLLLVPATCAFAQFERVDTRHSAVWFEFLGNGGLYSLNAERYVMESIVVRVGVAWWYVGDFIWGADDSYLTVPVTASVIRGENRYKLETGAGLMFGRRNTGSSLDPDERLTEFANATAIFGFRYEPPDHRVIYRLVATPFASLKGDYPDDNFLFSIGMSAGFQF